MNLIVSNLVSGYYLVVGATYCTHPISNFFWGNVAYGSWIGTCIAVASLGLNRLSELTEIGVFLFTERTVFLWISLSLFCFVFMMFMSHNVVFNSTTGLWLLTPMIDDDIEKEKQLHRSPVQPAVTLTTASVLLITYICLFTYFKLVYLKVGKNQHYKLQRNLIVQCFLICAVFCVTCFLYSMAICFDVPQWVGFLAQATYQISECMPLIAYIFFNSHIRSRVHEMYLQKIPFFSRLTCEVAPNTTL